MKTINMHIRKQEIKQVYLLYGEEAYLKKQYRDKLREAIVGKEDTMNYSYYEGKEIVVQEVTAMADTLPFFAEHRLIVIENSGFFKKSSDELADYIRHLPQTTYFVFVENEIDKRNRLYKAVNETGYVSEMKTQELGDLIKWATGKFAGSEKQITRDTLQYLIEKTGTNMDHLVMEIEKLSCYAMNREVITREDVDAVTTTQTVNKIFDMVSAIAAKNQAQALDLYYDLLLLKEAPLGILSLIVRQFNLLLQVKELSMRGGRSNQEIGKKVGLAPFLVGKYQAQAKRFSSDELKERLRTCAQMEYNIKTGQMGDRMAVELIIIEFSKV